MKFKILLLTVIIINTLALNSHSHQEEIKTIQNTKNIFILTEKEQIYLKDKKVITMCNNSNWAPIVFAKDGNQNKMQGIAIDILKEIEKRLGVKFKNIHTRNWKEGQQFLKDKKVDILPCYIKSPEREKYANFTRSYLRLPLAIFAARDKPIVSELDEIMDKSWTRQKSSGLIPKLQKQYPNMKIIRTSSDRESFQYVNSGKAYFTIATLPVASHVISKYMFNNLQIIGYTDFIYYLHIAVKNDDKILCSILDKALADISEERSKEIFKKWVHPSIKEPVTDYKLLGQILFVVFIIGLFFVYRQHILTGNIAKLKIADQALRASHERFFTVLDSIDATIYVADMETYEILFMNKCMIESFGRDMTGELCWKVFRGSSGVCPHCRQDQLIDKNGKPTGVYTWQDKNPVTGKWYNNYDRAIKWIDGRLVRLQIATDISIFKKMEDQLQQAQKMESIGTLAGGIAHDFNNILFPIVGHTEMLLEDVSEDSPLRTSLDEIYIAALRARELVKQILTFSRQDNNELKLMKMQHIIKETLKLIRSTIPTTIAIKQDIQPDCGVINADPTQIHQIIMNLATNAYHAMEETGGELKVGLKEIKLSENDLITPDITPGVYACLTIADTGAGMDKILTEKIFDPFFTTKEQGKGTGMGLSVVHGIVLSMNGAIRVYSEPGKGTEFHIYLPVVNNSLKKQEFQAEELIQSGTEHILLVDDEKTIITMEKHMLERLGYQVTSHTNSVEALEAFRASPDKFDLVITDMAMPNISGDKLSDKLTEIRPDIPVLLCTGFSEIMSEKKAVSLGIKGFLLKPIVMHDLSRKIREVLDEN